MKLREPERIVQRPFKTIPKSRSVVMGPQVWCEVTCDWILNQTAISMNFYPCGVLTHDNSCENFGVSWFLGFIVGLPPRGSFGNSPSDHETWSI
jgi:hypothetical protein